MQPPRFRATRGTMECFVSGTMRGDVRVIETVVYTTDHAEADAQFDRTLEMLRQDGWTVRLVEGK